MLLYLMVGMELKHIYESYLGTINVTIFFIEACPTALANGDHNQLWYHSSVCHTHLLI